MFNSANAGYFTIHVIWDENLRQSTHFMFYSEMKIDVDILSFLWQELHKNYEVLFFMIIYKLICWQYSTDRIFQWRYISIQDPIQ